MYLAFLATVPDPADGESFSAGVQTVSTDYPSYLEYYFFAISDPTHPRFVPYLLGRGVELFGNLLGGMSLGSAQLQDPMLTTVRPSLYGATDVAFVAQFGAPPPPATDMPEPASLAMLTIGLAGVARTLRRQQLQRQG
jgi:hypothetical protein